MGDNIHQLTSLPYANFDDEHSEGEDHGHSHGEHGHGHAHDHSPTIQSMNVRHLIIFLCVKTIFIFNTL